jgi:acetyltransferase-like isoleucine patch superfamily enzyme
MAEFPDASICLGDNCIVYEDSRLEAYGNGSIAIGPSSIIGGARIVSRGSVSIGKRFLCSWDVFVQDFDPHPLDRATRATQVAHMVARFQPCFDRVPVKDPGAPSWQFPSEAICIGDDVWVGAGTMILKGATLGDGCVVAAGAVVLRGNYPPGSVVGGNPARVVKCLESQPSRAPVTGTSATR